MRITRFGLAVLLLVGIAALARVGVMGAHPSAQASTTQTVPPAHQ